MSFERTDHRIVEKIEQSDLHDFLDEMRDFGIDVDMVNGHRLTPDDSWDYHNIQLASLNSRTGYRGEFEEWGYSEEEINAIFGNDGTRIGLSHPSRCVKDLIWSYMFYQEGIRLAKEDGDKGLADDIQELLAQKRQQNNWIDWDRAIAEFWDHETGKDYRSYIITDYFIDSNKSF